MTSKAISTKAVSSGLGSALVQVEFFHCDHSGDDSCSRCGKSLFDKPHFHMSAASSKSPADGQEICNSCKSYLAQLPSNTLELSATSADHYDSLKGRSTVELRALHTHTELSEFALSLQHGEPKSRQLEELSDVLASLLSTGRLVGFSVEDLLSALSAKREILLKRIASESK